MSVSNIQNIRLTPDVKAFIKTPIKTFEKLRIHWITNINVLYLCASFTDQGSIVVRVWEWLLPRKCIVSIPDYLSDLSLHCDMTKLNET